MNDKCPDHDRLLELCTRFEEYRLAMDLRLVKLNELRDEVTKDRSQFMRQEVFEVQHNRMSERMSDLEQASVTHVSLWQVVTMSGAIASFVVGLVELIIRLGKLAG